MKRIEPEIKITTNILEFLEFAEQNKSKKGGLSVEHYLKWPLTELIQLRRKAISNDGNIENTGLDIAEYLFKGVPMDAGIAKNLQMFSELMKLTGAQQYKKQINAYIEWLKNMLENDALMETFADEQLLDHLHEDPAILKYLIAKYERVNINEMEGE